MIQLRSLLSEQRQAPKLRVLFVGDHQTKANWSYAHQLINSGFVKGKIVGWSNASTAQLYRILKVNLSKRYDIVSIMGGDVDGKKDAQTAISNLDKCYTLAKKYGAKVVAITNPSKIYLEPQDKYYDESMYVNNDIIAQWVESQSKTDITINTLSFGKSSFAKNHYLLNPAANQLIAEQWKADVSALGIKPRSVKSADAEDILKLGSSGEKVKDLHEKLIKLGFKISTYELSSYTYGQTTYNSVMEFQDRYRLESTGTVDPKTFKMISDKSLKPNDHPEDNPDIGSEIGDISYGAVAEADTIIDYFIAKGLPLEAAAGIAGNLYVESRFDPSAGGDVDAEGNVTSIGLAQWHLGWATEMLKWCKMNNVDAGTVEGQLDYLWFTLSNPKSKQWRYNQPDVLTALKNADSEKDAANIFMNQYERPAARTSERANLATRFLNSYAGGEEKDSSLTSIAKHIIGKGLVITSPYGVDRGDHIHQGIDYKVVSGTDIAILTPGVVSRAGNWNPTGWGNTVEITHEDGSKTLYAHMSKINVKQGDTVRAGKIIGKTGGDKNDPGPGNSRGAHLHWEYIPKGASSQANGANVAKKYFAFT